jgi:dipeptide/tripeptide permease
VSIVSAVVASSCLMCIHYTIGFARLHAIRTGVMPQLTMFAMTFFCLALCGNNRKALTLSVLAVWHHLVYWYMDQQATSSTTHLMLRSRVTALLLLPLRSSLTRYVNSLCFVHGPPFYHVAFFSNLLYTNYCYM